MANDWQIGIKQAHAPQTSIRQFPKLSIPDKLSTTTWHDIDFRMGTVVCHSRRFSREELHSSRGKDRKNGNRENTIPKPPIHCVRLRQKSIPWERDSISSRIVAPVVVNPDMVSKKGIGYRINASAKIKRKHAEKGKNTHERVTTQYPSLRLILFSAPRP